MGTVYFPQGTTANQVCVKIQNRDKGTFGLWLLQRKVKDTIENQGQGLDDKDYETIKDSKYELEDGVKYVAVHYSGMDIELVLWGFINLIVFVYFDGCMRFFNWNVFITEEELFKGNDWIQMVIQDK